MLYIIRDIVFIILAIIGLVQIARSVVLFFMRSKKDGDVIMVVPIRGHDEEAEIVLRHAAARVMVGAPQQQAGFAQAPTEHHHANAQLAAFAQQAGGQREVAAQEHPAHRCQRHGANALATSAQPLDLDALAARFTGRGPWKKRLPQILETLEVLGKAQREAGGRWRGA